MPPLPSPDQRLCAAVEAVLLGRDAAVALAILANVTAQMIAHCFPAQQDEVLDLLKRRTECELRLRQRCAAEIAQMRSPYA
ncbi:hypothetical protein [Roseomonas sp. USHLN139]|uniref:hypothetical protein n=1 Tax=Roseomonas sp. USHLN139 TaxID=3081298 RepID=UPI003B024CA7